MVSLPTPILARSSRPTRPSRYNWRPALAGRCCEHGFRPPATCPGAFSWCKGRHFREDTALIGPYFVVLYAVRGSNSPSAFFNFLRPDRRIVVRSHMAVLVAPIGALG